VTSIESRISAILDKKATASLHVQTLGVFQLWRDGKAVPQKEWGREVSLQLFQFLITNRHRHGLHKEQIIDRIWDESDSKAGQQNFKVALHGINKVLEPNRQSRTDAKYIIRQGLTYQLKLDEVWIDVEAMDQFVAIGNQHIADHPKLAQKAYYEVVNLYEGTFLPNRLYEDWSAEERERIQLLVLNALISLSELLVKENPIECIRLAQQILQIDHAWEDAYRIQMEAYLEKGNRPMALKTYQQCKKVLDEEFGIGPLPETKRLFEKIKDM
jgi:DNA-binding SARP family transcriptional activator